VKRETHSGPSTTPQRTVFRIQLEGIVERVHCRTAATRVPVVHRLHDINPHCNPIPARLLRLNRLSPVNTRFGALRRQRVNRITGLACVHPFASRPKVRPALALTVNGHTANTPQSTSAGIEDRHFTTPRTRTY
jgi:hypothetical protein